MPLTFRTTTAHAARNFALFSLLTAAAMVHARPNDAAPLQRRAATYQGCYSSSKPLTSVGSYTYQSSGYCSDQCISDDKQAVMGLTDGDECWCGSQIPSDDSLVDDSKCDSPCTGYGQDDCGGNGYWSVYLTGTESDVSTYSGGSSSTSTTKASSSSSTTVPSSTVVTSVAPGHTVVVTIPASSKATSTSTSSSASSGGGGGSSNTAGIAAGVVVGVVALAGIIGALFFWVRHKKKKQAEEEYARKSQVSDFMRGASERKPPSTGYSHRSDQRLDPEAGRRNSVGSLADNQDYSRRILRVANPDSS